MMEVKVKLYGELEKYGPNQKEKFSVQLPPGTQIKELMDYLKIPAHQVMLIIKNGIKAKEDDLLKNGDDIIFLPIVGGG
ncbi:MAG: MoaD/ThiS family protein [Thermodesulfobacteriota bacterium]